MCSRKHGATLTRLGVDPGQPAWGDMLTRIETLPEAEKAVIKADIQATLRGSGPGLSHGQFRPGEITNLHVPSDVDHRCIDAGDEFANPGACGALTAKLHEVIAAIPDRCYATLFQAVID